MQVRCVREFAGHVVGDVVEVPDGSAVSPVYFEPLSSDTPPAPDPEPAAAAAPATAFGQLRSN